MPRYKFSALDVENKKVMGTLDARDEDDFRKQMHSRELFPTKFKALDEKRAAYRLKANEVSELCRQLASMMGSGITVVRAMEIVKDRDSNAPKLKAIYTKLHKDVQQGTALSDAMRVHGNAFPLLLINMVSSGETSGKLENVMNRMSLHYEKEHRLNGKIVSAMRYPKILAFITIAVVLIIFLVVLPNFFDMLADFEIPLITRIVIAFSNILMNYWWLIAVIVMVIIVFVQFLLSHFKIRLAVDKAKLKMPVIGKLLKIIYTARFSRTLSSLYSSGVSMIRALEITGTIVMNTYIEFQFKELVKDVRNGELLSVAVRKIDGFDNKLANTIMIGEEAGRLDDMLISTADSFEYEAEEATGALVALTEPVMIVVLGGLIMIVLLSVMLPMASLYETF
ncbi:MAG: type II secretion system F family protein [Defluviitaleaceae bacterium]|nr:type II secretion system F family protein [Defluviitaleaceae bacterium]MCL2274313.1 type II secretion system F family protein [Defluviitaleaceae bacterium]